jgi:hypothetical protein
VIPSDGSRQLFLDRIFLSIDLLYLVYTIEAGTVFVRQVVAAEGQPCESIFILTKGSVRLSNTVRSGPESKPPPGHFDKSTVRPHRLVGHDSPLYLVAWRLWGADGLQTCC